MDINVASGTTISVSENKPINLTVNSFELLTYKKVNGVRAISDLGNVNETLTNRPIFGKPTNISVGIGSQTISLELYKGISDAGQDLLRKLSKTRFEYSFKIVESNNTVSYFTATSSANLAGIGSGNTILDNRITLELTSDILTA